MKIFLEQFKFEITIGYVLFFLLLFVLNISCSIFNLKNLFYLFVVFAVWGGVTFISFWTSHLCTRTHTVWGKKHFLFGDCCWQNLKFCNIYILVFLACLLLCFFFSSVCVQGFMQLTNGLGWTVYSCFLSKATPD